VIPEAAALRREWRTNWRTILVASVMTLLAYLLVLFAFRLSKASYVVAARETSIVLSALIGGATGGTIGGGRGGPGRRGLRGAGPLTAGGTLGASGRAERRRLRAR
jgi:uncharacterized membrane protein YbhN (UPF0104 family)